MTPTFDFRTWERELRRVPRERFIGVQKQSVLSVASVLRSYVRGDGTGAHPGLSRLANEAGLSRNTTRAATEWLVDNRWIRRRPGTGRMADLFDLLPAEIPLAYGVVDLADVGPDESDGDLRALADLWNGDPVAGQVAGQFVGQVAGQMRVKSDTQNDVCGTPFDPQDEKTRDITSFPKGKTSGRARAGVPTREGRPSPPAALVPTGEVDRHGVPRVADRYGNRLASDEEVEAFYARPPVPDAVQATAVENLRRVRDGLGWKPGPSAFGMSVPGGNAPSTREGGIASKQNPDLPAVGRSGAGLHNPSHTPGAESIEDPF